MKRSLRILMALLGFAALGATPKAAQVVDQLNMTVPFQFVISGKTLPAGTYQVHRVWKDNLEALVITNTENNASATVLPTEVASTAANKPQVSFETAGGEHFLSKIETADHLFSLPMSRAALLLASGKSHSGGASGSSDGNN